LLKKITPDSVNRIIDIGCGDGLFSRELSLANPDTIVVGVDYSKRAIALASAMNPDISNLQFQAIDITLENKLPPFDTAVLMEVFEHIPIEAADIFMSSVRSSLREGGTLYLTVPHENKLVEYKHFQHFSVQKIINYIQPYFEIVEVVPFERIS
jgi:2-polyprenyl-3-methyl-5-hydroxy-6-metoxy-1,4-benzoquinol methylase